MNDFFYMIAQAVEAVSFAIMIYGALLAVLMFLKNEFSRIKGKFSFKILSKVRIDFGNYILLGLQFLIAADIIETILKPEVEELIELGGIVIIRILLSYFLTREIDDIIKNETVNEK
ncbi:MAG TPA: DUF1622 domain-containing protein [Ignavibacteria bacterium]|nr:DUF1622 domain-containing protein [Ignavibacteria bacterium]HMQ99553.1 DUF1622 domain-containing protein [Ignavibacteria bacterium]